MTCFMNLKVRKVRYESSALLCRTFTSWLHHQIQSLIASRSSVSQSLCSDADRLLIMETLLLMTMAAPAGLTMNCQYLFTTPTIFRNPCQSDEDFSKSLLSSNWSLENYSFQKLKYTFFMSQNRYYGAQATIIRSTNTPGLPISGFIHEKLTTTSACQKKIEIFCHLASET